jgi:hypothetical protein
MNLKNQQWDAIFKCEGRVFTEPHESITDVIQTLQDIKATRVLDMGCDSGSHLVAWLRRGFTPLDQGDREKTKPWLEIAPARSDPPKT